MVSDPNIGKQFQIRRDGTVVTAILGFFGILVNSFWIVLSAWELQSTISLVGWQHEFCQEKHDIGIDKRSVQTS